MRTFYLERDVDETGVSGTGRVAQGVVFDDGTCALRWLSEYRSTAVYASVADLEAIHGHGGLTRLIYTPEPPAAVRVRAVAEDSFDNTELTPPGTVVAYYLRRDVVHA